MDVADGGRHAFDLAALEPQRFACGAQGTVGLALEALPQFGAPQHADHSPDPVVVYGRSLPRSPDEADHGEALQRVGMQQVLQIMFRMRHGELFGQPVIVFNQSPQQLLTLFENCRFLRLPLQQSGQLDDEPAKPVQA